jgi:aminomethyltransferase
MSAEMTVKHTALYDRHVALGARMGAFAGFEMPLWYSGIVAEHLAVRNKVGLFDLSHMGEVFISGREAFDLLQWLTCNDLRRIGDGQCQYTLFPTPEGGTIDDLIIYQINPEDYMLVVNASNTDKDYAWIVEHNKFDCKVVNRSDELTLIAVQGPDTDKLLKAFGLKTIDRQQAFTFRQMKVQGNKVIVAGTGYTGERGFELIVENDLACWLWDRLMELGQEMGTVPIGLGARDTLRLEMAYSLWGHELTDSISVLEANLAWAVRFGPDFIGKEFLLQQRNEGVKRMIAGFVTESNQGAPRHAAPVYGGSGKEIGYVTSGSFSPSLEKGIALALLPIEHTEPGAPLLVDIRGKRVAAKVCETPFYRRAK